MQNSLPWVIALAASCGLLILTLIWALWRPAKQRARLPLEWSLTARPVFSADERRVYRLLKEALPQHAILSKLPLVRFCQPTESTEVRYWYDLLGTIHVSFAICSPNGRVLAAIDLDSERSVTGRSAQIKQSVLSACRVRYLRCPADRLPSVTELQLLVPFSNSQSRSPQQAPTTGHDHAPRPAPQRRPTFNSQTPQRGASSLGQDARNRLWQDSGMFRDSFFAQDRPTADPLDEPSGFHDSMAYMRTLGDEHDADDGPDDIVGVVVDAPRRYRSNAPRHMGRQHQG